MLECGAAQAGFQAPPRAGRNLSSGYGQVHESRRSGERIPDRGGADGATPFPLRVAAIDVGSNAIRVSVAEFSAPTIYRVLDEQRLAVRLGHDVFRTGRLHAATVEAAAAGLRAFAERLARSGVSRVRAVATSAVREAANAEALLRRVRAAAGLEVEVISGAEEARLVYLAVRSRVRLAGGPWALVDVGGGSVELSLVDEHGIRWSDSLPAGAVRLLEALAGSGGGPDRVRDVVREHAAALRLPGLPAGEKLQGLIATGGNIEALARLAGGAPRDAGVQVLPLAVLRSLVETLSRLSCRERIEELGLRPDRADVILPAALVYEQVCTRLGAREIVVPFIGVREGVLLDLVDEAVREAARGGR